MHFTFRRTSSTPLSGEYSSPSDCNSAASAVTKPMEQMLTEWSGWAALLLIAVQHLQREEVVGRRAEVGVEDDEWHARVLLSVGLQRSSSLEHDVSTAKPQITRMAAIIHSFLCFIFTTFILSSGRFETV